MKIDIEKLEELIAENAIGNWSTSTRILLGHINKHDIILEITRYEDDMMSGDQGFTNYNVVSN
jgi:hypothetical protein